MSENQSYLKRGRVAAIWCTLVGVLIALALIAPFGGLQEFVIPYAVNFAIALGALFSSAWVFGGIAGNVILARGWSAVWTGLLLGITCLTISVLAGSIFTFFSQGQPELYGYGSAASDYIIKPLFWVSIVGLIPCVLLSFLFAKLIARKGYDGLSEPVQHGNFILRRMLLLVSLAVIAIVGVFWLLSFMNRADNERHLIPEGFTGPVVIVFGDDDGEPPEYQGSTRIYRIPSSGILRTQLEPNMGAIEQLEFAYVRGDESQQTLYPAWGNWNNSPGDTMAVFGLSNGSARAGGGSSRDPGSISFVTYFIGTQAQLDSLGNRWSQEQGGKINELAEERMAEFETKKGS